MVLLVDCLVAGVVDIERSALTEDHCCGEEGSALGVVLYEPIPSRLSYVSITTFSTRDDCSNLAIFIFNSSFRGCMFSY